MLGIFVHESVRACVGPFQKLLHKIFYHASKRNWTSCYTDLYGWDFDVFELRIPIPDSQNSTNIKEGHAAISF